ncbi:general amidase-like protein [Eremomyces bilateralis CBS 781.70]|uniref:amidase n=1 Tax=Eremomyces bilateralis CBS 781.70 TaxID=1392243 RepID=A0A6G1FUY0_9PEZI|nr:general amidase-like protein [Eremomyces bilateralis CBS 781.70]KAF1809461.1 general amidase-like protein [Eremomyces bilateralis CBS 781.70]
MAEWEVIAKRKQQERDSKIPAAWLLPTSPADNHNVLQVPGKAGILTPAEIDITENYDATGLRDAIAAGKLKSLDVAKAFSKRAAIAQQLTNCLTEIFFDEALKRAEELDAYYAKHGQTVGPLHGVPVSIKDCFRVKGADSTTGIASLAFKPAVTESALVQILRKAGAVLHCKTNVPMTMMALDSHNNVWGRTMNPINRKVTAGGSSGGEGALVAMRGSAMGVGTDVGGSIRIPAMCNGLYGIKPSHQRIPFANLQGSTAPGGSRVAVAASAGPLTTTLRDCELFFDAISSQKPWEVDPEVIPATWPYQQPALSKRDAIIGIVKRDGLIEPLPPIARLIDEVASRLRSQGITVVEMDITPLFSKCQSLANKLFGIDGNNYAFDLLESKGEPLSPWLATRLKRGKVRGLPEVTDLHARRMALEAEFLKYWNDTTTGRQIDAFICPMAPHPVPLIDRFNGVSYTSSFVLLDAPAGNIPVRAFGQHDLEGEVPKTKALSSWDERNRELWTNVDRSVYLGTPLCIQVVAPRLQERRLTEAMKVIDDALKASGSDTKSKL